jgi:SAM-dependent methyltransferase
VRQSQHRARRCLDFLRQQVRAGDRWLEIGSGDGAVLAMLLALGAEATGLEPDLVAARRVERTLRTTVIPAAVEDARLEPGRFDGAVLVHVLEHVFDPVAVLAKVRYCLRPGGTVLVETPNVLRPKVGPRRVFSFAHNYHFSPRTMTLALCRAGFAVTALRVFNHDSFQVLAASLPAGSSRPLPAAEPWQDVVRAIRAHRVRYLTTMQFLWRKLPGLRERLLYGTYHDLAGSELARWLSICSPPEARWESNLKAA